MGFFGIDISSLSETQSRKAIVARYHRLKELRFRLNNKLVRRLSVDVLRTGARRLGMLHDGTFVFNTEDESSVLMDYCIYDVYRQGRNAVDEFVRDSPPDSDTVEMECLHAMQHATYAVVLVRDVERGVGCHVTNLFTDESFLLVDVGFSQSARGGLVLATRLLDFGDFFTTSGAALPIGILDDDQLAEWQRQLRAARNKDGFDPAPMIRSCLESGASSNVAYIEGGESPQRKGGNTLPQTRHVAERKRLLAAQGANKRMMNRRCKCGSGKMFKNCCGKQ